MRSKHVAIATCYYENNYGSKLQAFATQYILDKFGISNDFLYCSKPITYMKQNRFLYYLKKVQDHDFEMVFGRFKKKRERKHNKQLDVNLRIRENKLKEFEKRTFRVSPITANIDELQYSLMNYDTVLVGSDQLWAPSSIEHGFYTLESIHNVKKISYSTSFGVTRLQKSQIKRIKRALSDFEYIGVREESGRKLINHYVNKQATVVLDPTLLLNKEDWIEVISEYRLQEGDYLLFYFLGDNPWQREIVRKIKKAKKIKIIGLLHLDSYIAGDDEVVDEAKYDVDPFEFLTLIRDAKYVCTDSFHGTAMSLLFQKQFITFGRTKDNDRSINTRVINLLIETGAADRYYNPDVDIFEYIDKEINYVDINQRITILKDKSLEFLKEELGI